MFVFVCNTSRANGEQAEDDEEKEKKRAAAFGRVLMRLTLLTTVEIGEYVCT